VDNPIPAPGHLGIRLQTITPDYLETLGVVLKRGRAFAARDDASGAPGVAIINESFARRFWPSYPAGPDPVGKRLAVPILKPNVLEIVGVVGDVRESGVTRSADPQVYVPEAVYPPQSAYLAVRAERDPRLLSRPIEAVVRELDGEQSVADIRMMSDILDASVGQRHLAARLLGAFAAIALLLAVIGLYGVLAYVVAQRTAEIGIRRALGGRSRDILSLVLGKTLALAVAGGVAGLAVAFVAARVLQALLFDVSPTDAVVFVAVGGLFVLVALVASFVPAWRALRISPLLALRV
jgi:predicted permease